MSKLGPLLDVPGAVKIRLLGTQQGGKWANVLHAKFTGGTIDTAALGTLATAIRTSWGVTFAPQVSSTVALTTVECTDLSSRTGAQNLDTVGATGTGSSTAMPGQVSCCVSWKIPNRYRGGHPRMYLPPAAFTSSSNGQVWTTAYVTAVLAAARAFRNAINASPAGGATWQLCAVSYFHKVGGVEAYKTPPEIYIVSDAAVHTRVDTMRRRLGKETS